jgi:uncharacterized protein
MDTLFAECTPAVQVIVLVQQSVFLGDPVFPQDIALRETLSAVLGTSVARRALALDGTAEDWLPTGFDPLRQRGSCYGERLAAAFADAYATAPLPMLLIRGDALGVTPGMIEDAARSLISGEADATYGPASDGGFWLLGLHRPDRSLVVGVPAPTEGEGPRAGRLLLDRLASDGLRVALAPRLEIAGAPALRF